MLIFYIQHHGIALMHSFPSNFTLAYWLKTGFQVGLLSWHSCSSKNWTTETIIVKILVLKAHVLEVVFFIVNNIWKIWNKIFASFFSQLSWCKEVLFVVPNMAPSWGLLYNSSSIVNINFKGLCQMSSIFVCFKEFYFQVCFVAHLL